MFSSRRNEVKENKPTFINQLQSLNESSHFVCVVEKLDSIDIHMMMKAAFVSFGEIFDDFRDGIHIKVPMEVVSSDGPRSVYNASKQTDGIMFVLYVYVAIVLLFTQNGYSQKLGEPCVLKHSNTPGFCAPAAACQSARRDYQTKRLIPTFCNNSLETPIICCSDESSKPNTDPIDKLVGSKNQQMTSDKQRISEKKCAEYSSRQNENVTIIPLLPGSESIVIFIPKCNYNGVELILGGEDALERDFPHMAAIGWVNLDGTYSFLCAGSLISTKFILTAAHCTTMRDSNPVIVRLGVVNIDQKTNDGANTIEVPIKNIRKHPQYKASSKYHDIALLELLSDIDFDASVSPACLWSRPDLSEYTRALTTGWRVVDSRAQITSKEMKKVSVTLLESDQCDILLRTDKNNPWNDGLTEKQLCAGTFREREDTCQLNTGSPLQVTSHETNCIFYLIGVTSLSDKCAKSGSPAVYTRVSSYLDWIESVVWPGES